MIRQLLLFILSFFLFSSVAQTKSDPLQTASRLPLKISHAEPIFIDMIRDLGARKGEKEINVGWEISDEKTYSAQGGFVEYEFSPLNRLGLELEIPFNYSNVERIPGAGPLPHEKIEGLKMAAQYTFLVSGKQRASLAIGHIFEMDLHSFPTMAKTRQVWTGAELNPFFIAAKRWGRNFHTLLYTGPVIPVGYAGGSHEAIWQINFSVHYVLPAIKHFIGIEMNQEIVRGKCQTVIRPQLKLILGKGLALGIATGIPVSIREKGLSFISRLIYEPNFGTRKKLLQ